MMSVIIVNRKATGNITARFDQSDKAITPITLSRRINFNGNPRCHLVLHFPLVAVLLILVATADAWSSPSIDLFGQIRQIIDDRVQLIFLSSNTCAPSSSQPLPSLLPLQQVLTLYSGKLILELLVM